MRYPKYFKSGQKILLRPLGQTDDGRHETLTLYIHDGGEDYFDLDLPYRLQEGEDFPFSAGMACELLSEALGLGLRLPAQFLGQQGRDRIRVTVGDNLEILQRRQAARIDITAGLRYTKGRGELRTFRSQWEKNIRILQADTDLARLRPFPRSAINLSSSGIRMAIRPPVEIADLCLLFLELSPGDRPICALAEVIWVAEPSSNDRRTVGMRFIDILAADQKRIERLVRDTASAGPGPASETNQ